MTSFTTIARSGSAALLALVALGAGQVKTQAQTDLAVELREAQATLSAALARVAESDAKLTRMREHVGALTDALATANGEAQKSREAYERLLVQMEGLGMAALDPTNSELQQNLLAALSDLRLLETQKRALTDALYQLSEATLNYAKSAGPVDGQPKKALEDGLAMADKALAKVQAAERPASDADLQNARVVSLKEESGIFVLNVGSRHGVRPGTPISIYRQDKPIARVLVVDVRNGICGAVMQELVSKNDPIKVGDSGRVESIKS